MDMDKEELLQKNGWVVECESPFEIRHKDGSFASLNAAKMVVEQLRSDESDFYVKLTEKLRSDCGYYIGMAVPVTGSEEDLYMELSNEMSDLLEWCHKNYRR